LFLIYSSQSQSATAIHYPRFNGYSYLELPPIPLDSHNDSITVLFHTTQNKGLLLYAYNEQFNDYIALSVQDGRLVVSLSTGDGKTTVVKSRTFINHGRTVAASIR